MSDLAWVIVAALLVVLGAFLNGFFRNFFDQRQRRELRALERSRDLAQGLLDKTRAELERGTIGTEQVRKLVRIIEVHREQVELIENGITPEGFTPGGDLYNQADKQLYAGLEMVMSHPHSLLEPDPAGGVRVAPAPPAPPIPTSPPQEEPAHAR